MTYGFRIRRSFTRVDRDLVGAFRGIPVANISDCMSRMAAGGHDLRPMHRSGYLCGPALTVRCRPGDNLMLHKALDLAEAGDVIAVAGGGDRSEERRGGKECVSTGRCRGSP